MEQPTMNVAQESIVVNAPAADLYERWLHFEDLPKFIKPMRDVRRVNDTHFTFTTGPKGENRENTLEIMFQNPGRRIAWRILSDGVGLGVVSFEPQSDGSTEVTLKLRSAFNPLLSSERATEYLGEFKRVVESARA
jgi:uncharacterized membrane protein